MNTIYIDAKIKGERKWLATQSASGYYRSVINIVSLAGARQGIMITPSLFSVRVRESLGLDLRPSREFLLTTWFNAVNRVIYNANSSLCNRKILTMFLFFSSSKYSLRHFCRKKIWYKNRVFLKFLSNEMFDNIFNFSRLISYTTQYFINCN